MDEKLIELTTEETFGVDIGEVVESEVLAEDLVQNIETEENVEIIKVETVEEFDIEIDESVGWVGGDNTRHYSLYGRDESDQHPITAITGLREELNDIEALDVVYSNKRNQANYYLWEDENTLQENRVGYFVSICDDINKIKMCTSDNDIFGVTVDGAGFIGAQADIPRDIKYGLVVTTGVVHVRCEQPVNVGDYVISNDYGYAQSNKNGYKVVGRHQIDGIEYAEIILTTPINRICKLSDEVEDVNTRMDDAETNIVAAINMANAAYNKAGEVGEISEEAIKNALEALDKSMDAITKTDGLESNVSSANEVAVQARAIAESAAVSAETIRNEVVKTSNETLAAVNDLIEDLEPITTWSDPDSGNTGAEYLTTYIRDGLATKTEVQTVVTKTDDNKSAIEYNAEKFQTLVSSVDKYSVGEFSQSYGLTRKQAKSILKEGMIYVPTKHIDADSHSETFTDESEPQWFTPHNYYIWDSSDWIEIGNSVAFFSETPIPSNALKYWYIDSDNAPEGYEPRALYIYEDGKWVKVNIFYNNPGNRMVSSISQEVDNISLEIINARGSYSGLDARLTNTDAQLQLATFWNQPDSNKSNLAAVKLDSSDDGSSLALVVMGQDGKEQQLSGASIVLGEDGTKSYIALDANNINLEGYTTINKSFTIDEEGSMIATGGEIAGWKIASNILGKSEKLDTKTTVDGIKYDDYIGVGLDSNAVGTDSAVFAIGKMVGGLQGLWKGYANFYVTGKGDMCANSGKIGGFTISSGGIGNTDNAENTGTDAGSGIWLEANPSEGNYFINCKNYGDSSKYFRVRQDGCVLASSGSLGGWTFDPTFFYKYADVSDCYKETIEGEHVYVKPAFAFDTNAIGKDSICFAIGEIQNNIDGTWKYADFRVTGNGKLYAEDAEISGTLKAGSIIGSGEIKSHVTGTQIQSKSRKNYVVVGDTRVGFQACDTSDNTIGVLWIGDDTGSQGDTVYKYTIECRQGQGRISGNWTVTDNLKGDSSGSVVSDFNKKNTIQSIDEKYSIAFDNFRPVTYKYNNGKSNRLHTGFIAQEIKSALEVANINTKDFAGLVIFNRGTETEEWALRYEEFIALNTWQIQKAKARITELENEVVLLKEQVATLIKGE